MDAIEAIYAVTRLEDKLQEDLHRRNESFDKRASRVGVRRALLDDIEKWEREQAIESRLEKRYGKARTAQDYKHLRSYIAGDISNAWKKTLGGLRKVERLHPGNVGYRKGRAAVRAAQREIRFLESAIAMDNSLWRPYYPDVGACGVLPIERKDPPGGPGLPDPAQYA